MGSPAHSEHIPALDGIRGLAILGVIAFHARTVFRSTSEMPALAFQFLSQGRLGVTLFFVLSGFLITGILLDSRQSAVYFERFYFRRVLRIFPLYFAYLFLVFIVIRGVWVLAAGDDPWKLVNPGWYLAYLQNLPAAHANGHLFLNHLWSLAIEEQFYLVWPAIVWFVPRRWLAGLCVALAIVALILRATLAGDGEAVYRLTFCRVDGLALGAFVAVGYREFRATLLRWAPDVLAVSGLTAAGIIAFSPSPTWDGAIRTWAESAFAVAGACVVVLARSGGWLQRLFSWKVLRQCGKYSYAMYVLHEAPEWLIGQKLRMLAGPPFPIVLALKYAYFPILAATVYGMARVSWRFLEAPFLRLKDSLPALGRRESQTTPSRAA